VRYFGQPRHTGDQRCDMCGCWVHGERMHLAGGWALICEGCRARADQRAADAAPGVAASRGIGAEERQIGGSRP